MRPALLPDLAETEGGELVSNAISIAFVAEALTERVSLVEMILACDAEASRLEVWGVAKQRQAEVFRRVSKTLELVLSIEKEFVELVRVRRETAKRAERIRGVK